MAINLDSFNEVALELRGLGATSFPSIADIKADYTIDLERLGLTESPDLEKLYFSAYGGGIRAGAKATVQVYSTQSKPVHRTAPKEDRDITNLWGLLP